MCPSTFRTAASVRPRRRHDMRETLHNSSPASPPRGHRPHTDAPHDRHDSRRRSSSCFRVPDIGTSCRERQCGAPAHIASCVPRASMEKRSPLWGIQGDGMGITVLSQAMPVRHIAMLYSNLGITKAHRAIRVPARCHLAGRHPRTDMNRGSREDPLACRPSAVMPWCSGQR